MRRQATMANRGGSPTAVPRCRQGPPRYVTSPGKALGGHCTVALSQRASSPRLKSSKAGSTIPVENHDNRAFAPCRGASGQIDDASSSGPIAQCNSAPLAQCNSARGTIQSVPRLPDFIQSAHNSWGTSRRTHPNGSVALFTRAEMTHWINSIKAGEFEDLIS
jgi:hypothetical protein